MLWYAMAPRDLARLRRAMTILAEVAIAAGAREVFAPVFGFPAITSVEQARALEKERIDARRIECMAFHPLGSARVANDPRGGVVDQNGEAYDLPGLFVADGSILPTSIGVNSQVPIMAMATRIAWRLAERFAHLAKRPRV
jgi:choline dehydrogenase-like flavoprotein